MAISGLGSIVYPKPKPRFPGSPGIDGNAGPDRRLAAVKANANGGRPNREVHSVSVENPLVAGSSFAVILWSRGPHRVLCSDTTSVDEEEAEGLPRLSWKRRHNAYYGSS